MFHKLKEIQMLKQQHQEHSLTRARLWHNRERDFRICTTVRGPEKAVSMSHKNDSNVTTWGRAGVAGLSESPERQASVGPTQEILLPWLCRAPPALWAFP